MTVVNIKVQVPVNGALVPAEGSLRWEPSGRRIGVDGALILPKGFPVQLVTGEADVDVDPSGDLWVWSVTEFFDGQVPRRRYFAVPESGPVNYTDLVEMDPATLDAALTVTPDPDNPGLYLIGV
jgi:hypothetical protein